MNIGTSCEIHKGANYDAGQVDQSYADLRKAVLNTGVIDPKTTFMLQMGAAMAIGCYP